MLYPEPISLGPMYITILLNHHEYFVGLLKYFNFALE